MNAIWFSSTQKEHPITLTVAGARAGEGSAPELPAGDVPRTTQPREAGVVTVGKTLSILEIIAERGAVSAREVSQALGYPLSTVYRLLHALVQSDYLVHLKQERRFELGYKLDRLGAALRRQLAVPAALRGEIFRLHESAAAAAYFAVYRGADAVVAVVVDSPEHPRLTPLNFEVHGTAHATAVGKIMLSGMRTDQVRRYLDSHGTPKLTTHTIESRAALEEHLAVVAETGVAWERNEFVPGMTCAAVGVRTGTGLLVGSVAVSAASERVSAARERELERLLRDAANRVGKYYRSGRMSAAIALG